MNSLFFSGLNINSNQNSNKSNQLNLSFSNHKQISNLEEILSENSEMQKIFNESNRQEQLKLDNVEKVDTKFQTFQSGTKRINSNSNGCYSTINQTTLKKKQFIIDSDLKKKSKEEEEKDELKRRMGIENEISIEALTPPVPKDEPFFKYLFNTNYSNNFQSKKAISTNSENVQFNFGSMKFKNDKPDENLIPNGLMKQKQSLTDNFFLSILNLKKLKKSNYPLNKINNTPNPYHQDHFNLNTLSSKRELPTTGFPFSSRRRSMRSRNRNSKCVTDLRRQNLIDLGILVEQAVTPNKKTTFVNLSKLFQKSPSMNNTQFDIMNLVQESMKYLGKDVTGHKQKNIDYNRMDDVELSIEKDLNLGKRPDDVFEEQNYQTPLKNKQKYQIKIKKDKKSGKNKLGCNCSKIQCARLHCICFKEKGYCGDHCNCVNCLNREEHKDTIKKIKNFTKEINPLAFKSKIDIVDSNQNLKISNRGCSCSKNNCLKNYCECHKNGLQCSSLCKCNICKNDKIQLSSEQVQKLFKKCSRKKKKFVVINQDNTIQFKAIDF